MDEADLYFVDTRNATTDHRTGATGAGGRPPGARPMTVVQVPGSGTRVYSAPPQQAMYPYGNPYMNPYLAPQPTLASNLLGRISTGQLVDIVAQIFAALMPLPTAPTTTADTSTDVGNLILYQGALAQYAKRDEQVRTLGSLVTKLVG